MDVAATTLQPPETGLGGRLRDVQLGDPTLGLLLRAKELGEKPAIDQLESTTRASRRLLQIWDQLMTCDGVLCRKFEMASGNGATVQVVVPKALHEEVLRELHEGSVGGHLGVDKTLARLKERFYWPGHHNDVRDWCQNCGICASRKNPAPKAKAQLQHIVTGYPMQLIAMDIMGPFPDSPGGNTHILVVSDYFTRWTEAYPIPNQEATTVANKLVNEFFRFSPPEQLHSDQGHNFESEVIAEVCKLLGIIKSRTPYHPQSDGLVERFNKTLLNMLATAVEERPFQWEGHLRRLCFVSVHQTTGYSPFYLMFGRQAQMLVDIMYGTPSHAVTPLPQYVANLHSDLEAAYEMVQVHVGVQFDRQKNIYDKRAHGEPFKRGDLVWLHSPVVPRGQARKLNRPWTGPYRIVTKLSDAVYRIQHSRRRQKRLVVTFDRLKPCSPNTRLSESRHYTHQRQQVLPASQPLGTNLELLDDSDFNPPNVNPAPADSTADSTLDTHSHSATFPPQHVLPTPDPPDLPGTR